ncbi:unnamed protein product [Urochloa decumbens]|uniref:F-box domain-containing protein n=1 Tax=Urochloa decumbens TaxID=240449 RepID=A0ABC9CSI9_9POAL
MEASVAGLFSSLPEEHQDEILRRLPLPDAVRTSALSRAWRRRWESVPGLALSFPNGTPPGVVDGVLLCHTGGAVSSFAFIVDNASASHAGRWLVALSRRGVQSIDLRRPRPYPRILSRRRPPTLHSSIFSCAHLVSLHLQEFCLPPLPVGFAGFPVLEDLYLSEIKLPPNREGQLQAIIHGSPLLRVLYLEYVQDPVGGCVIQAPNLHSLTFISSENKGWRFGELPCLDACICYVDEYDEDEQDFGELLARVAQVEELTLHLPFREYEEEFEHGELLSAQWTNGMCSNLQDVEILSFDYYLPMDFIKLILSKASRLRTLSLEATRLESSAVSQDDRINEILTCTRASAESQVLFKMHDEFEYIHFGRNLLDY